MSRKRTRRLEQHFRQKIDQLPDDQLSPSLEANLAFLQERFGNSQDLIVREFTLGTLTPHRAALIFIDGLVSNETIAEQILYALMHDLRHHPPAANGATDLLHHIHQQILPIGEITSSDRQPDAVRSILVGDAVLLLDGSASALLLNTKGFEKRSVQNPGTEGVVRGPRDSFTETLRTNTVLVRRRLRDPDLRIRVLTLGERSHTDVALLYLEGVADLGVVKEIEKRLKKIRIDSVSDSGTIEQYIEDSHWSPFPQIQNTERPDKAVANLLEGKVVIIVDGSPFCLIAPAVLTQFYQSPEDYYERFLIASLLRLLRVLAMTIALMLPSLYIAFASFHPEMIPSKLMIAMAAGRSTVPFPSVVEALLMEVSIEILREASVRLPGPIGPTIGIVGALVIGEAAVQAGIVSPIMVIIVALTTIGSFASPSYSASIALRMLRFPLMLLAAMLGLYGIMLFIIIILIHLCSLKSFGVPYLSPLTPSNFLAIGDAFIRLPLYRMIKRPNVFARDEQLTRTQSSSAEGVDKNEPTPES
jgi:spore germination protein KA